MLALFSLQATAVDRCDEWTRRVKMKSLKSFWNQTPQNPNAFLTEEVLDAHTSDCLDITFAQK